MSFYNNMNSNIQKSKNKKDIDIFNSINYTHYNTETNTNTNINSFNTTINNYTENPNLLPNYNINYKTKI